MSQFPKRAGPQVTRRQVLGGLASVVVYCVLDCKPAEAQVVDRKIEKALDDPKVQHSLLEFKGGQATIGGYLARPRGGGKHRAVLVVTGSSISDEYIRNTTAMLAQAGFVGFAPDIFALQRNGNTAEEKRRIFAEQITDDYIFADLDASMEYLKGQEFVAHGKAGIMGFCFGGRTALMYAGHSENIGAVAPYYGNLKTPEFAKRPKDPVDIPERIHAAVQGHYCKKDDEIPLDQLDSFKAALTRGHTSVEIFEYDAPHGFFAYNRTTYDEKAAHDSWKRTVRFLEKQL